jgi:hypothetical protein
MEAHAQPEPSRGRTEESPDPYAMAFRDAVRGTDVHMRIRAAALRAARSLAIEDRVAAKLPRD